MDSVRVSAKTVQDALMEAAIELGTSSDNIEYTVIDEGSKGFFGIGGRKATIEAKKKVTDEDLMKEIFEEKPSKPKKEKNKEFKKEYKQDYKQEKKEGNSQYKEAKKETKKEFKKENEGSSDFKKEGRKEQKKPYVKEKNAKESAEAGTVSKDTASGSVKKEYNPKDSSRNGSVPKDSKESRQKEFVQKKDFGQNESYKKEYSKNEFENTAAAAAQESLEEETSRVPRVPADPEEAKKRATDFLTDILNAMGMEVQIQTEFEDGNLSVNIEGDDMGIMIGKRGQTLDSLQYLTSLVVNKGNASYVRVKLDTEDYRERRKATLENLARNIASKVKKTRRPVFLEPMNPYERRIIHSALQNDPYVTTHSEGDEPYRKVVVTLKKDRDYDRRSDGYSRSRNYNHNRRNSYSRESFELENEKSNDSAEAVQISEPVNQEEE